jgi:hypothetical protein
VTTVRNAPVVGIAVAGNIVAATLDEGPVECRHVELWNAASNKATHLGKKLPCDASGLLRGPAILGNRVVWASSIGGNLQDWTVWTASTTSPTPKALAKVNGIPTGDPDPVVIGSTAAGVIAYAVGSAVTALRANGSTAWKQTAPAKVTLLASGEAYGKGSEVTLVSLADGKAVSVDGSGKMTPAGTTDGITVLCIIPGGSLIAQKPGMLVVPGSPPKTIPIAANARLVGCLPDIAIYRVGAKISGLRVSTGKAATLLTGTKVVAVSPKGIAWATKNTLHWRPLAAALKPLG